MSSLGQGGRGVGNCGYTIRRVVRGLLGPHLGQRWPLPPAFSRPLLRPHLGLLPAVFSAELRPSLGQHTA